MFGFLTIWSSYVNLRCVIWWQLTLHHDSSKTYWLLLRNDEIGLLLSSFLMVIIILHLSNTAVTASSIHVDCGSCDDFITANHFTAHCWLVSNLCLGFLTNLSSVINLYSVTLCQLQLLSSHHFCSSNAHWLLFRSNKIELLLSNLLVVAVCSIHQDFWEWRFH